MTATLLPQLKDRKDEVEGGVPLDSSTLESLQALVDGLHEKVKNLKERDGDEARQEYLKTVDKAFAELKTAKPKKENEGKYQKVEPEPEKEEEKHEEKTPEPEPEPLPELYNKEDKDKDKEDEKTDKPHAKKPHAHKK